MSRFGFGLDDGGYWQQVQQDQFDRDNDGIPDYLQSPGVGDLDDPFDTRCWEFDQNGDGRPDHWAFDTQGVGQADQWAWDTDQDGRADHWAWDDNGDGRPDRWGWDQNGDGQQDQWAWDTNGDGQIDLWGFDTDGNGNADLWTSDHNRDGKVDTWLYDENGNGRIDKWVYDTNGDEKPDRWAFDKNDDGSPDYWEKDVDKDGIADHYASDENGDGKPDLWLRFEADKNRPSTESGPSFDSTRARWRIQRMPRMLSGIPYDPLRAKSPTIDRLVLNAYSMCAGVCRNPALHPVDVAAAQDLARNAKIVTLTKAQWVDVIRREKPNQKPEAFGAFVDLNANTIYLAPAEMTKDLGLNKKQLKELRARRIGHERWHIVLHKLGVPADADSKTKWDSGPFKGELMSVHHAVLLRAGNY